jgi:AcrR family transcriptional regulator
MGTVRCIEVSDNPPGTAIEERSRVPYDNSQRAVAAATTRTQVLSAAHELFLDRGFAATTVKAVADSAGVSQETIYKSFGSKAALLKAVYDVALVGDADAVPLARRPEAIAVKEAPTPDEAAQAYAELAQLISERTDPLLRVLLRSRGSDRALDEFAATTDRERLIGSRHWAGHWHARGWLRSELTVDRGAEVIWVLNSPEPRWLLLDQGWSRVEFTRWLGQTMRDAVLSD